MSFFWLFRRTFYLNSHKTMISCDVLGVTSTWNKETRLNLCQICNEIFNRAVPGGVTVYLGDHDRKNQDDGAHIKVDVVNIVQHPDFKNFPAIMNDIAIVTMKYSVRFSRNVRPICFPSSTFQYSGLTPVVAGWGAVRPGKTMQTDSRATIMQIK